MMDYSAIWDWIVKNKKTIITIIIILIILIYLKRNWYKVRQFLNPQAEETVPESLQDPTTSTGLSDSRMIYIQGVAREIYDDIEETPWYGHEYEPYASALALYDNEIEYMGKYYRDFLTKGAEVMSEAINSQIYTWGSTPRTLETKLKTFNL